MLAAFAAVIFFFALLMHRAAIRKPLREARSFLRAALRSDCALPSLETLRGCSRELLIALHRMEQLPIRARLLPYVDDDDSGMAALCLSILKHQTPLTGASLLHELQTWQRTARTTLDDRASLPGMTQAMLLRDLLPLLRSISRDADDWHDGERLAGRLINTRRPLRLLLKSTMSAACTAGMISRLRCEEKHELLAGLNELMRESGLSMTRLQERHMHRQASLSQALERTVKGICAMQQLDWTPLSEAADPLHQTLSEDPSGVYARMDEASRNHYRRETARLARLFRADEIRTAKAAVSLACEAQDDPPRCHVGYWLTTPQGQKTLMNRMNARRGHITIMMNRYRTAVSSIAAGVGCMVSTFFYLSLGLPLLAAAGGGVMLVAPMRRLMAAFFNRIMPQGALPALSISRVDESLRTLIVLPAELDSGSEAIACIRQLSLARHASGEGEIDFMLLGDFTLNKTLHAVRDHDVCDSAAAAAQADDTASGRIFYMQRGRTWDPVKRCFRGADGLHGLLQRLVTMLTDGSGSEDFVCTTVEPRELLRRYAYVLVLPRGARLMPGVLHRLIGVMEHPLHARRHGGDSAQGVGMLVLPAAGAADDHTTLFAQLASRKTGCGGVFFRPDTVALDLSYHTSAQSDPSPVSIAARRLTSAVSAGEVCMIQPAEDRYGADISTRWQHVYDIFRAISWLCSPSDDDPQAKAEAASLRTSLWEAAAPAAAMLAVLCAVLMRSHEPLLPVLTGAALIWLTQRTCLVRALLEAVMLPFHALLNTHAACLGLHDALRERPARSAHLQLDERRKTLAVCWSQGLTAGLAGSLALTVTPPSWSGLLSCALFACFMWLPDSLHRHPKRASTLDASSLHTLTSIAQATWHWFEERVTHETHGLPPAREQIDPPRGAEMILTPSAAAAYLLAVVSAAELKLITPDEAAGRLACAADTLEQLERSDGLFYDRYDLQTLEPDGLRYISAVPNGLMCAALLTSAQMLRANLDALRPDLHFLSSSLDAVASRMHLARLYDHHTGCFAEQLDASGDGSGTPLKWFASPALLLCFTAVMRGEAPCAAIDRLECSAVPSGGNSVMLSPDGSIADYALPALFLPCRRRSAWGETVRCAIAAHVKAARHGFFGLSEAASDAFDVTLRFRQERFGLDEFAAHSGVKASAVAPYAVALSLPWAGQSAVACLKRMQGAAMFGPQGYFDSLMLRSGGLSPVQIYDAAHQGLLLCAVGEACAGAISRHFMMLPCAAAWEALLQRPAIRSIRLPKITMQAKAASAALPETMRSASPLMLPPDATVIGSQGASALVTSDGYTIMRGEGVLWTVFSGSAMTPEGLRVCVSDGRRTMRIGQGCQARYGEGHALFTQTLGKIRLRMTVACDPISQTVWHMVQAFNTGQTARGIVISDLLLPSMTPEGVLAHDASVERLNNRAVVFSACVHGLHLCHTVCADAPFTPLPCCRCDAMEHDAARALFAPESQDVCMGFACKLTLAANGRATVSFATSLTGIHVPEHMHCIPDESSVLSLARVYSRIQTDHIGVMPDMAMRALRMTGSVLWHGLAHQGAAEPLRFSRHDLCALGVDAHLPFVLLSVRDDDFSPVMDDALLLASLLSMRGWHAAVVILCGDLLEDDVRRALQRVPQACASCVPITVLTESRLPDGMQAALEAAARLILCGSYDALAQYRLSIKTLSAHEGFSLPAPFPDGGTEVVYADASGGFDPETLDYMQLVSPEKAPPGWTRMITGRQTGMLTGAGGVLASYAGPMLHLQLTGTECLFAEENGIRISPAAYPYGSGCVIRLRHAPGMAVWHAQGAELDMHLICFPMDSYDAGVRLWRIRNTSSRMRTLTLHFGTCFIMGEGDGAMTSVTPMESMAASAAPAYGANGFIAAPEGGYETLVMSSSSLRAMLALHGSYAAPAPEGVGCAALLRKQFTISAGETIETVFITGAVQTMDEAERMMERIRAEGASTLADQARQRAQRMLDQITVSTPDEPFNLLINRLLPSFLYAQHHGQTAYTRLLAAAAFSAIGGHAMRTALLNACTHADNDEWLQMMTPLLASWYIARTGDSSLLQTLIPANDDTKDNRATFRTQMMRFLTAVKLQPNGLPAAGRCGCLTSGLAYLASLNAFMPFIPQEDQADAVRMAAIVSAAAERALQTERTCLASCWAVFAGMRSSLPPDCEPADFSETIPYLYALCLTEQYDDAWALFNWLNPALHHDALTPPWQPEPDGRQMASAWMYLTAVEQLLGFEKRGSSLRMKPHLPKTWNTCAIALNVGASRWHITLTDEVRLVQVDGVVSDSDLIELTDDGQEHHVRWPLHRHPQPLRSRT